VFISPHSLESKNLIIVFYIKFRLVLLIMWRKLRLYSEGNLNYFYFRDYIDWGIPQNKGIPRHLIRTAQNMYMNAVIKITKEFKTREDFKEISQGVRQGCSMSPTLFNLYFDEFVRKWQSQLKNYFLETYP
jgi:hypothetical protein